MADIPDLRARLRAFSLEHPNPELITALYDGLKIDRAPIVRQGPEVRYEAVIQTPGW